MNRGRSYLTSNIPIMRRISDKVKQKILQDKFYTKCARHGSECKGRITWEHTLIYAGKQIDEVWAIIPLCEYHHAVNTYQDSGDLRKEVNVWIALNRATDDDLIKYSKAVDYIKKREDLNKKYGTYT